MEKLNPNTAVQLYLATAQGYTIQGNVDEALTMLSKYADTCTSYFFPLSLHGDEFFDCMEEWFEEFDLGKLPLRDERLVKESMLEAVVSNPYFQALHEHPYYQSIIHTMMVKLL